MSVRLISGRELTPKLITAWRALQASDDHLSGPFFCPEFTASVALSKDGVLVAVWEEEEIEAFLPFEAVGRVGKPVGCLISDFQGLVARPDYSIELESVLRASGLAAFDFDHVASSQQSFLPYATRWVPSPRIDLSRGFEEYVRNRRNAGSHQIAQCEVARRKLEREVAPVTFVARSPDATALAQILAWKSLQYRRTGKRDVLRLPWVRETIERVHTLDQSSWFGGCLSLLYAGDQLIAGHLGMATPAVWHYWFTAYDTRYARYSPGLILLLEIAKSAAREGMQTLELGKGTSLYKQRLMNAQTMVGHGRIELPSWFTIRRKLSRQVLSAARKTAEPARSALRRLHASAATGGRGLVRRLAKQSAIRR
jgi:CelD/BcsL family acetyltransferase involved in cellulose biosynthesis